MATNEIFLLFESAPGLLLSRVKNWDQIAQDVDALQECCLDYARYCQVLEVVAFHPFANAEEALEVQLAVTNGTTCGVISNFLRMNLPSTMKKKKKKEGGGGSLGDSSASSSGVPGAAVGVCDPALGKSLSDEGFHVVFNPNVVELLRGCRLHFKRLTKQILSSSLAIERFQVGLGHTYSRCKMKEDPRKQDKPIMQSIALIDSLDKNVNSFAMKLKEWYGWHFPELVKIVGDTEAYCKVLKVIQVKEEFNEQEQGEDLLEACGGNEELKNEILAAMRHSMGQEISHADFVNIISFADQVLRLCSQRKSLQEYLSNKLEFVSPNLKAVVGEVLAARLISHAGALVNLAKYPASTIQILGAEKALFRALKSKSGRTPKYGILFHSSFIGRVQKQQHRGRMSRYLASKCALAARIDAFSEGDSQASSTTAPTDKQTGEASTAEREGSSDHSGGTRTNIYGLKLREQLEERLKYLADGIVPRKNLDVMREAAAEVRAMEEEEEGARRRRKEEGEESSSSTSLSGEKKKKKKNKRKHAGEEEDGLEETRESAKKKKKVAVNNPMMVDEEQDAENLDGHEQAQRAEDGEDREGGAQKKKKKNKKKKHQHGGDVMTEEEKQPGLCSSSSSSSTREDGGEGEDLNGEGEEYEGGGSIRRLGHVGGDGVPEVKEKKKKKKKEKHRHREEEENEDGDEG